MAVQRGGAAGVRGLHGGQASRDEAAAPAGGSAAGQDGCYGEVAADQRRGVFRRQGFLEMRELGLW